MTKTVILFILKVWRNGIVMNVSLTPELESLVNHKVKTGLYNSASEVVREALRLLEEEDRIKAERARRTDQKN